MEYRLTTEGNRSIPVQLTLSQFNEFILKHLPEKMQKRHYRVPRVNSSAKMHQKKMVHR